LAGHNKWSKIKHRKKIVDKRRSKAWTMCSRALISAARQGGADPNFNFLLRAAIDEARYHNVPSDNIERAIKKGAGGGDTENYEAVRYEGYGPGGVAVIIDALTNNRTRTACDLRLIFGTNGGNLGVSGCVGHSFVHKGRIALPGSPADEARVMEAALDAGADDVLYSPGDDNNTPGTFDILTPPTAMLNIKDRLAKAGFTIAQSEFDMIPLTTVLVAGAGAKALVAFVDELEENEDVKHVYTNAEIPDSEMAALQ
jgi:YebC/PmpR family DNA-binding regulatory protein